MAKSELVAILPLSTRAKKEADVNSECRVESSRANAQSRAAKMRLRASEHLFLPRGCVICLGQTRNQNKNNQNERKKRQDFECIRRRQKEIKKEKRKMLSSDYENKLRKETNKLKSAAGWLRGLLKNECKWL